jgi:hypothetical protein
MARLVRSLLLVAASAFALLGVGAASSSAAYSDTLTTPHFVIHYTGDSAASDRITNQTAGDVGQLAESAYTTLTSTYGYPAPLDDGDGNNRIELYVENIPIQGVVGEAIPTTAGNPTPGYIILSPGGGLTARVVAHELFHLIQFGIFVPDDGWLLESTAEWMGIRFEGFPSGIENTLLSPDMSLDCLGDKCGNDDYERGGYSRWSFFEYLSERFGGTIVKSIFQNAAANGDPAYPGISDVADVLAAKSTTLTSVFNDWAVANLTGNYTAPGLKGLLPPTISSTFTGPATTTLPPQTIAVNHLAARYVEFKRGDGTSQSACYAATLHLDVTLPAALTTTSHPYFHWYKDAAAAPLAVSGGKASITVPWDTCAWAAGGFLVLPNPSTTADAQSFTVSGTMTVDKTHPANSFDPPAPAPVWGPVVPVPPTAAAPQLTLHAPELIRVSPKTRVLRLIVFSNGDGVLRATLGSTSLGSFDLQPGNNDARFTIPQSLVQAMRRTAGSNLLTLTGYAPNGDAGTTLTRRVALQPAAKPKRKPKHKR